MIEYGARTRKVPAPPHVVWESLTDPHQPGARPWLNLLDDEVEPTVLESARPTKVVWSSLWPTRPNDRIVLELSDGGVSDTSLRFTLLTPDDWPDETETRNLRKRMSHLLFADLRFSYGQ